MSSVDGTPIPEVVVPSTAAVVPIFIPILPASVASWSSARGLSSSLIILVLVLITTGELVPSAPTILVLIRNWILVLVLVLSLSLTLVLILSLALILILILISTSFATELFVSGSSVLVLVLVSGSAILIPRSERLHWPSIHVVVTKLAVSTSILIRWITVLISARELVVRRIVSGLDGGLVSAELIIPDSSGLIRCEGELSRSWELLVGVTSAHVTRSELIVGKILVVSWAKTFVSTSETLITTSKRIVSARKLIISTSERVVAASLSQREVSLAVIAASAESYVPSASTSASS